ncbi:DUF4199 domain-containing protein [Pontibacter akesuensis]|uniref:DUF4199 domain-containing protein n=1 Tax=Pontibacter akesuensis TaxID=388950 RepID=A0A1I7KML0_9BACT|nr:DUF4199 domain-containing protein [Pontibacter akesuensis]GHA77539.1 hypothetical protein GCM10007389_34090 [Pontibacter akesuensis]SFU98662.1 Protein of unknown function [Pontibacter akesuensis]
MTEKEPSIWPISLKYGALTGVLYILYSLFTYISGNFGNFFVNLLISLAIGVIGIVLAMREFKQHNFGYMSYGKGLGIGIVVMVIASIISGIFSYIYIAFIDPSVVDKMIEASVAQMAGFGLDEEMLDQQRDQMAEGFTPLKQLTNAVIGGLFMGLLLSLIISAIMKKNRPEFE